jgi:multiple sugar transport system permease protein
VFSVVALIVLIVFAILWLVPSLFALKTALTENGTAALGAGAIIASFSPTLHSFSTLFGAGDIWNWYIASAITSVIAAVMTVFFASMAAYALSRLRFRGRNTVFLLIVLGIMIPTQVLIVPIFQELGAVNLLNTYWGVILPQVPAVIAVFIFKQFFDGIPKELEEAARIDGASRWKVYWSVIMPLSQPVIAAVTILTFVGVWNNLLLPLFVVANPNLMTIPVGLATVQGSFGQRYADIQAGAILGALPLVILYVIFQRQIVEGVTGSGLKG